MNEPKPSDLNDAQWQAVAYENSHLIIVAGPGTGKTHTITYRIARLVKTLKSDQKILAITFTNKAANQMRERLEVKVGQLGRYVTGGTFHRFALSLLREFNDQTPLPKDFQIALPDEVQSYLEEIFPNKTHAQRREIIDTISRAKSTKLVFAPDEDYQRYHRFLRGKGLIDFDDILREALILLENDDIAWQIRQRYPYIFVDEYQDINLVQNALLKTLVQEGVELTAIGDPNQSIYGFRGSQVELFHRFTEDFPSAAKLYLTENYRSTVNLLAASAQVITKASRQGVPEAIAKIYDEGRLVIHEAATDRAEAEFVAHQIEQLVGGLSMFSQDAHRVEMHYKAQRSFGDIAILYRLNTQKNVLIEALEHLGIPYSVALKPKITKQDLNELEQEDRDEALLAQFEEAMPYNVEKVSLLTLHAAKGLEFPVVFIVGCEAKLLPLDLNDMKGDPQEERRLFYVGMTRAKEHLYLTRAGRRQLYSQTYFNPSSLFLADIEEDLKVYENSKLRRRLSKTKESQKQQLKLF
ncbi:MAG: ATP-dependent helicase [Candidatus Omnitrophota bacterium]